MHKIEPPDSHYFSAALGWVELGNPAEARAELGRLSPAVHDHPDVLELHWLIAAEQKCWEEGLQVAEALQRLAPKRSSGWLHRAYSLRRVPNGGVQKAWDALLPAADLFPKESIIPYNLACYACQLQQLDTALLWIKRAITVGNKDRIKRMALEDPDLEALRKEIEDL